MSQFTFYLVNIQYRISRKKIDVESTEYVVINKEFQALKGFNLMFS